MAPQAKRPRSTSVSSKPEESKPVTQSDASPRPTPHETLWFEDGNIVLATDAHLYRVHKGILARQSSVFNDMLRMPQPEEGQSTTPSESWDGVPVVNMVGDRDEDVYNLLMTVYDRKYYTVYETTDFNIFSSLITMSSKYNFCDIRLELVKHLSLFFPDTLTEFDTNKPSKPLFNNPPDDWYFQLLSLTHSLHHPALLPLIMYHCAVQPFNAIFNATKFIPGNMFESLLAGRERIIKFSVRFGTTAVSLERPCGSHACLAHRCRLLNQYMNYNNLNPPKFPLEMTALGILAGENENRAGVCTDCRKSYREVLQQHRQHFWNSLPLIFNLANWGDLRQMSVA